MAKRKRSTKHPQPTHKKQEKSQHDKHAAPGIILPESSESEWPKVR
jgi:hypothetical protein